VGGFNSQVKFPLRNAPGNGGRSWPGRVVLGHNAGIGLRRNFFCQETHNILRSGNALRHDQMKEQRKLQEPKKMTPEPPVPTKGASSPK